MLLLKRFKIPSFQFRMIICVIIMLMLSVVFTYYGVDGIGNNYVYSVDEVKNAQTIIILGAHVFENGRPSQMLGDRLDYGFMLYEAKKAPKIIVSGDHGTKEYDEVNAMREYLLKKGVPSEDIFMDHAGFDTYDSMYRAKEIFLVESAIIVSQGFHVTRGIYIARELGIEAYGVASDPVVYIGLEYNKKREIFSRLKAFFDTEILFSRPKYLGEKIPVWGNGEVTKDK